MDEFNRATSEPLQNAIQLVKKFTESRGCRLIDIDEFILVGGGSNMPQIKETLQKEFSEYKDKFVLVDDPSMIVSKGAACSGLINVKFGGRVIGRAACSYGIEVYPNHEKSIKNLIFRGDSFVNGAVIGCCEGLHVSSDNNGLRNLKINIYENNSYKKIFRFDSDCKLSDIARIIPIPEKYWGRPYEYKVDIELKLLPGNTLKLTFKDRDGNSGEL